ncbi:MAG: hypothetical protein D6768_00800 [Chloroflexi bacterium]|nr:MAG: hypothetical protein D6768_00800 [Chloroflexota bacterium]
MSNVTISGGTPVEKILAATRLTVHPNLFVLAGINPAARRQVEADLAQIEAQVLQYIAEPDVLTLLLPQPNWNAIAARYPGAETTGPLRLFTFSVAMDWEVVGFLAAVAGLLARAEIPLGALCGYYRDHLFIAQPFAAKAEAVLRAEIDRCRGLEK